MTANMSDDARAVHPLMRIPVPWVFALVYLAGAAVQRLLPIATPKVLLLPIRLAGFALMAGGVALAAWCLLLFRSEKTTTTPGELSNRLVTWGPYRFTRNPMYVSLTLCYLGEAGILLQIWPLLLLPIVLAYLHRTVIPVEEQRLSLAFGAAYTAYADLVRRWI